MQDSILNFRNFGVHILRENCGIVCQSRDQTKIFIYIKYPLQSKVLLKLKPKEIYFKTFNIASATFLVRKRKAFMTFSKII
jgi:hypothetical protein